MPKGVTKLNKGEERELLRLSEKEEKSSDDLARINELNEKAKIFKDPPLSKTATNYLTEKYAWFKYEKRMASKGNFMSFLDKGKALEAPAIQIMAKIDDRPYTKNQVKKTNDYLIGEPDIVDIENGIIIDTKVSWNINTFLKEINGLQDKYWFQAQGYMELFNVETSDICFLLLDTPEDIIQREYSKIITSFAMGEIDTDTYDEKIESLAGAMVYNTIPMKRRIIRYRVNRDRSVMPIIYRNVDKCREFLTKLDKTHMKAKTIISLPPKKVSGKEDNT